MNIRTTAMTLGVMMGVLCRAGAGGGQWTLTAWNNLGMHCMDDDYSVFSILPPFNTVNAQLLDQNGRLVVDPAAAGIRLTYEAAADPDGSINTHSAGKTNFWQYAGGGYGVVLRPEAGLAGNAMPGVGNVPQGMTWGGGMRWFEAAGIPITPVDDAGRRNPYPLMRITARNAAGMVLAKAEVVLPVSDEMDCRACHASGSGPAGEPAGGWVNEPDGRRDFRLNILRLHDERSAGSAVYVAALAVNGFAAEGLYESAVHRGKPVLCAVCHASEALGTGGYPGVAPLTRSMHAMHATVINPDDRLPLGSSASRTACYQCHPGSATKCLRGAMGAAVAADGAMAMQCQSCHGGMGDVGAETRTGWLDEPTCQSCHSGDAVNNDGLIRYLSSFAAPGRMREPANRRFATNADTPAAGKSLYRFSSGHGGLQCSACHGSTHAEFPATQRNDNLHAVALQGHVGVLAECTACHAATPVTVSGGPHGMHPTGNGWAREHADDARAVGLVECQRCHGKDYRGTVLSRAFGDRTLSTKYGTLALVRGVEVGCYECHNGPSSSNATSRLRPSVAGMAKAVAGEGPTMVLLPAGGTAPVIRIVQQPQHGTVGVNGMSAVYYPEPGYSGADGFTWTASDASGYRESLPASVSLTVGVPETGVDSDGDGLADEIEYALGLDPTYRSAPGWLQHGFEAVGGAKYQWMQVPLSPLRPKDGVVAVQVSGDLRTWTPAAVVSSSGVMLRARDTVSTAVGPMRFMRLTVSRPRP